MSPVKVSKFETAIRVVLDFNEAFNKHDIDGMMTLMSDDCVVEHFHPAPDGTVITGKDAVRQFWQAFFRESPQARIKPEDVFSCGPRWCIAHWRYIWDEAAGDKGYVRGADIYLVKDGLISKKLSYVKG